MPQAPEFRYDVFLSHSTKDKAIVRPLAERLRADGLQVWFDEWEIQPGDSIPAKIEDGLEHSRVLVLCMSANAFGSDWAQLESYTFRFRDPLNKERRFIPLRLDDATIKGSLAQLLYINWCTKPREQAYVNLFDACQPPVRQSQDGTQGGYKLNSYNPVKLDSKQNALVYAFSPDDMRCLTGHSDYTVRVWDMETGCCLRVLRGHTDQVWSVIWCTNHKYALSGSWDNTVRLWDVDTGCCVCVFEGHTHLVWAVALSADQSRILSADHENKILLWDVKTERCLRVFKGHKGPVKSLAWNADGRHFLSGADDNTVRLWDIKTGSCLRIFKGHTGSIGSVTWSADQNHVLSGSDDKTVRLWDVATGRCLRIFEGHNGSVTCVLWSANGRYVLSGSLDKYVYVWDVATGNLDHGLIGQDEIISVVWSADGSCVFTGDKKGCIQEWDMPGFCNEESMPITSMLTLPSEPNQVQ